MFSYRKLPSFFNRIILLEIFLVLFLLLSYCYKFYSSVENKLQRQFFHTSYEIEGAIMKFSKKYNEKYNEKNVDILSMIDHIENNQYSLMHMVDETHIFPLDKEIENSSKFIREKKMSYAIFDYSRRTILESKDSIISSNYRTAINKYLFNLEHALSTFKMTNISFFFHIRY